MNKRRHSDSDKLTLQELARELEKYRLILETASDGFVTINENHEVVYLNAAAEDIFGYSQEELLGHDLNLLIPPEHRARHREYVAEYLRTGRTSSLDNRIEVEGLRRDGTRFPAGIRFSVAEVAEDRLLTARIHDLSEQYYLAEQLKLHEKLALVGEMVATVSHEIRTPLALIGGFASQVLRSDGFGDKDRHKLDIIVREVARLETLLRELNELSRPLNLEKDLVDLFDLLQGVDELMEAKLAERGVGLKLLSSDPGLQVTGDRDRLSQVFINLIHNAIQASESGAVVEVFLQNGPNGRVVVEINDQGHGIHRKDLERVFTPFFTTKIGGTGLGLPVANRIVGEHGGTLSLTSREGQGTTVSISLPAA
jgi:PAS domain S-box-containing protein